MYNTDKHIAPNRSRIQIAKNNCYEIQYDEVKNRIYFTLSGYWKNKDAVPEYLNDWQKVLQLTRPHFSVLSDLRTMITHPPHFNSLHLEVLRLVKDCGVARMAQVSPSDRIATLQINQLVEQCSLPLSRFESIEDAKAWLNSA